MKSLPKGSFFVELESYSSLRACHVQSALVRRRTTSLLRHLGCPLHLLLLSCDGVQDHILVWPSKDHHNQKHWRYFQLTPVDERIESFRVSPLPRKTKGFITLWRIELQGTRFHFSVKTHSNGWWNSPLEILTSLNLTHSQKWPIAPTQLCIPPCWIDPRQRVSHEWGFNSIVTNIWV